MNIADIGAFDTTRLRVAVLEPKDAAALQAITDDPAIIGAIHFLASPFTRADAEILVRGDIHGVERFFGAWTKEARLVGTIGAGRRGADIEIGYWFGTRFHGHGYAAEAVGALIARLRREFPARRIIAECRRDNVRSWGLLAKLGFRPTGAPGERPERALLELGQ
ncbi:MAG TPA: GNAT family N-acetyltransferase [Stellaceae bacterium]|nr:GNAT family N-acetyltransferase [Stellaceae bacterium]